MRIRTVILIVVLVFACGACTMAAAFVASTGLPDVLGQLGGQAVQQQKATLESLITPTGPPPTRCVDCTSTPSPVPSNTPLPSNTPRPTTIPLTATPACAQPVRVSRDQYGNEFVVAINPVPMWNETLQSYDCFYSAICPAEKRLFDSGLVIPQYVALLNGALCSAPVTATPLVLVVTATAASSATPKKS
ncbi:MAG: hypothetical protein UV59_C0006G0075 [Candidatus Gottesmanbacteria bacterium GW2011_GWA1_43_11]|uniref:Uncharacterized protein n=1 Tax=Candidatus Gottesmanbacteria bacterium GW2011_GWA1_43_11 TaxID=1618436 RepID=A0A0G1CJF6_9BACT|nr:MAG: hypothetical protein UV59_C0006G0075 [Candidatus Gottesmanbacteria bacterium GW2011_GWA1_43_11]